MTAAVAAIDCGSNSIRLLVVASDGAVLERALRVTRLSEGLDEAGVLADAAIERTANAIRELVDRARGHGAGRIRIVATSAVRDAQDRDRFLDRIERECGIRPDVLDGSEEARLSFAGATSDQPRGGRLAIVDIGGGSTELVVGRDGRPERSISTQIGCVRHTERFAAHGVLDSEQLAEIDTSLRDELSAAVQGWPTPERLIGVAGTVTTLAAIDLRLDRYDPERVHGHQLTRDAIVEHRATLAALGPPERLQRFAVLTPGREDVLVVGASILLAVLDAFSLDAATASELEILHGVVTELRMTRSSP